MRLFLSTMLFIAAISSANVLRAQDEPEPRRAPNTDVLAKEQWKQLDESVGRGLTWLETQQRDDGSFEGVDLGQPAVTSFCVMAFLAQGESPVDGKYQQQMTKAIDFIADQQKPNGLIALNAPSSVPIPRDIAETEATASKDQPVPNKVGTACVYNHAISALALCEAYGQCDTAQATKLAPVIEKAIAATLEMQAWGGKPKRDVGGWRYSTLRFPGYDADIGVTGWQLMFLRSAKNAGFDVPQKNIDAAVQYIQNCFSEREDRKVHGYFAGHSPDSISRATAGAGILALAHAGKHNSKEAIASGEWLLAHDFAVYDFNRPVYNRNWLGNRYQYGAVLCAQGMYQLGGKYWEQFFPPLVNALLENQEKDGSWISKGPARLYGTSYSTSLCILSLSVPNQMLPIFQR